MPNNATKRKAVRTEIDEEIGQLIGEVFEMSYHYTIPPEAIVNAIKNYFDEKSPELGGIDMAAVRREGDEWYEEESRKADGEA